MERAHVVGLMAALLEAADRSAPHVEVGDRGMTGPAPIERPYQYAARAHDLLLAAELRDKRYTNVERPELATGGVSAGFHRPFTQPEKDHRAALAAREE